jgi:hypothetical protein
MVRAAQQDLGHRATGPPGHRATGPPGHRATGPPGHRATGVVAVTRHGTDGSRHVPLGVRPYRPESRRPRGRAAPPFHTKPQLAWERIAEARAARSPFRLVVADSIYGEHAALEAKLAAARRGSPRLDAAQIPYVMGLRPSHGSWQLVEDPTHPPACRLSPLPQRPSACPLTPGSGQPAMTALARTACARALSSRAELAR